MDQSWLVGVGAVATALALGLVPAMTAFFGRMAFRHLSAEAARTFLRAAFPIYYMLLLGFTVIGGLALALPRPVDAGILTGVAIVTLFAWLWLMPIAHRLDELQQGGEDVSRELVKIQGRASFIIFSQILALIVVVVRLAVC